MYTNLENSIFNRPSTHRDDIIIMGISTSYHNNILEGYSSIMILYHVSSITVMIRHKYS
jgi:hypothetical protein